MTADQFRTVIDFEQGLQEGDKVRIRWTNCHNFYDGIGIVVRVNAKSIRVKLTEYVPYPTGEYEGYPAGREITAPRIANIKMWSVNNRVEPVNGFEMTEDSRVAQAGG